MNIVTFTGEIIDPLNPDVDRIHIEDIAHSLANSCRFTGHTRRFYSVAQHSVLCSRIGRMPDEDRLTALMHDASEAYLTDISRPVKRDPKFGAAYAKAERRLEKALAERFGLQYPYPTSVKWADDVLLRSEQRDLMPDLLRVPGSDYLPITIVPWPPRMAERQFLARYRELSRVPAPALS